MADTCGHLPGGVCDNCKALRRYRALLKAKQTQLNQSLDVYLARHELKPVDAHTLLSLISTATQQMHDTSERLMHTVELLT